MTKANPKLYGIGPTGCPSLPFLVAGTRNDDPEDSVAWCNAGMKVLQDPRVTLQDPPSFPDLISRVTLNEQSNPHPLYHSHYRSTYCSLTPPPRPQGEGVPFLAFVRTKSRQVPRPKPRMLHEEHKRIEFVHVV